MKNLILLIALFFSAEIISTQLFAQTVEEIQAAESEAPSESKEKEMYVIVEGSSDAVVLEDESRWSKSLGSLRLDQKVTVLDSTQLDDQGRTLIKVRAVIDKDTVVGWVKKVILSDKPASIEAAGSEGAGVAAAGQGAKGIVTPSKDPIDWDNLDLTSARMKPKAPVVPWWVYVGGGAVVTGVGIIILSDDDDDPDDPIVTPPLTVGDATITVTCGEGGTFDPLTVSEGEEVRLMSIEDPTGLAMRDGNLIIISPQAQEDFTLTFTMTDDHGQVAMGTLSVNVDVPSITVGDLEFEAEMGGNLEFNIFATINCPDCELSSVGGHPSLDQLEFSEDGNVSLSFNPEFSGMLVLPYTVMNDCGSTASGLIRINIEEELNPPEANDVTVTVICGEGGSADPLDNDVGEGLSLEGFETSVDWVVQEGDLLLISPDATDNFEIVYTVVNSDGLSAQATVFVTVIKPPFEVDNFNLTAESGQTLEFLVLDEISCSECVLLEVTGDPNFVGELDFQNGIISIVISPDFSGEAVFTFVIRDACGTEATGTLTIIVSDIPCDDIVGEVLTTNSDCGIENGVLIFATEELFGAYNFLLNGEPSGDTITGLAPGTYTLTVIEADNENCREDFEGVIEENPFEPDISFTTVPGDCANSGDVQILVNEDPLLIDYSLEVNTSFGEFVYGYDGDDISSLLNLMEGDLNDNLLLGPIQLTFSVPGAEERCNQTFDLEIPEEEIPFSLEDLEYESTVGEEFTDNFLDYAVGTDLVIIDHQSLPGISFSINTDGTFTFEGLEVGTYIVEITVEDICGRQLTGIIMFEVEPEECVFDVSFTVIDAGCGQSNGLAFVEVFPPNNQLEYLWSNNQEGQTLQNVSAGIYSVTVTDPTRNCSEDFAVIVGEEDEGEYLNSFETIPGNCNTGPGLLLETEPNADGFYILEAISPDGDEIVVEIPTGFFFLEDIIDLFPGTWQFTIIDPTAGESCAQSFTVELPEASLPELVVNEINPPSGPGQSDGSILITVSGGIPPYTLIINDDEFLLSSPGTYEVSGISPGVYEMIIIDSDDCFSDVIVLEIEAQIQSPPWLLTDGKNGLLSLKNSFFQSDEKFHLIPDFSSDPEHIGQNEVVEILPLNSAGITLGYRLKHLPFSASLGMFSSSAVVINGEGLVIGDSRFYTFFPTISWRPFDNFNSLNIDLGFRYTMGIFESVSNSLTKAKFSDLPLGLSFDHEFGSNNKLRVYGHWVFNFEDHRSSYPEYGIQFSAEIR
ncbi:MAG: hypothetical protein EA362_12445 [Saprospirales bacterium]|nr:MAG: hypothetical protein EA362_12445 [Saprospirales bacterium]